MCVKKRKDSGHFVFAGPASQLLELIWGHCGGGGGRSREMEMLVLRSTYFFHYEKCPSRAGSDTNHGR